MAAFFEEQYLKFVTFFKEDFINKTLHLSEYFFSYTFKCRLIFAMIISTTRGVFIREEMSVYFSLELPISEENRSIHDNFTESFDGAAYFPRRSDEEEAFASSSSAFYAELFALVRARATRAECNRTHKENPLRSRGELSIKASDRSIEINRALDRAENFNRRWRRFHPPSRRDRLIFLRATHRKWPF